MTSRKHTIGTAVVIVVVLAVISGVGDLGTQRGQPPAWLRRGGQPPARQAAQTLWPLGLAAIGANCGEGLDMIPEVLAQMREVAPEAPLIVKPNAGLPRLVAGATVYDLTPQDFAARMSEFVLQGARVIGSCCGSSPDFIRELRQRIAA
jgi:5-methyltetrahydrofolate--homocysteine methyltransferase